MSLIAKILGSVTVALCLSSQAYGLGGSVSADYVQGFEPSDPYLGFALALDEAINTKWTLSLSQDVTKNIVIDSERDEWSVGDTRVGLRYRLFSDKPAIAYTVSGSLTLPLSHESQYAEIYSKPTIALSAQWLPSESLVIAGSVYIRDTISAYETTPTKNGEGGWPIEDYSYGASHSLTLQGGAFAGGYSIGYFETQYPRQDRLASEARDYRSNLPSQGYQLSVFLSRTLWTNASINLAYIQGSALVQEGYEDYVLFDESKSLYSIGFEQAF
jgi:hypothetical protein